MEEAVEPRPLSLKYNLLIWRLINVRLILYEVALTVKLFLHRARPDQATSNCLSLVSVNFEAKLRQQDPPSPCCLYLFALPCWLPAGEAEW